MGFWRSYGVVVVIAAFVAAFPFLTESTFYLRIAALVFIFSLAVLGLNLLMGFAGQVSLGHAGFFGIGAYAVAVAPTHFGVPSWLALVVGVAGWTSIAPPCHRHAWHAGPWRRGRVREFSASRATGGV